MSNGRKQSNGLCGPGKSWLNSRDLCFGSPIHIYGRRSSKGVGMVKSLSALTVGAVLVLSGSARAADAAKTPTFTKDIAPIFQAKCEACHRPDNMAPMSLQTYEEARPWAKSIASRVGGRQMPPWHIDKTIRIQKFKNHRALNDDPIEAILAWVA